jgi:hypothetical protein
MEQNPPWEDNSCSPLMEHEPSSPCPQDSPLDRTLSHMNPVHIHPGNFILKFKMLLSVHLRPGFPGEMNDYDRFSKSFCNTYLYVERFLDWTDENRLAPIQELQATCGNAFPSMFLMSQRRCADALCRGRDRRFWLIELFVLKER